MTMANSLDSFLTQVERSNEEVDRLRKDLADASDTARSLRQQLDQVTVQRNDANQRVAKLRAERPRQSCQAPAVYPHCYDCVAFVL
jgi:uncharacterized coiled-coil DUF342 family protein